MHNPEILPNILWLTLGLSCYLLAISNSDAYFESSFGQFWLRRVNRKELRIIMVLLGTLMAWIGIISSL